MIEQTRNIHESVIAFAVCSWYNGGEQRNRPMIKDTDIDIAKDIIEAAERDLGPLTNGQRIDLLCDCTSWNTEAIREMVNKLRAS